MKTLDLTKMLKSLLAIDKLYPNTLPDEDLATGVYRYDSDSKGYIPRGKSYYQFLTSGSDRNACEQRSGEILDKLNTLTFPLQVGNTIIEGLIVSQLEPIYVGLDKNNNYLFSFNTTFFIEKDKKGLASR